MSNRNLLVVIAIIMVAILGVIVMQYQRNEKPMVEQMGDSANEAIEEIGDEIDDHTTTK